MKLHSRYKTIETTFTRSTYKLCWSVADFRSFRTPRTFFLTLSIEIQFTNKTDKSVVWSIRHVVQKIDLKSFQRIQEKKRIEAIKCSPKT